MGTSALPVRDYMTSPTLSVGTHAKVQDVQKLLESERISAVGVIDEQSKLVGAVSRADLLRVGKLQSLTHRREALLELPDSLVTEVMTTDPISIGPDETLGAAGKMLVKHHIHRVFVKENGNCVGVLSTSDVMRAICEDDDPRPVSDFCTKGVVQVKSSDPVSLGLDRMQAAHVRGLVVTEQGWPVGIFAQPEALAAGAAGPKTPVGDLMNPRVLVLPDEMPVQRAAEQALALRVRRVVLYNGAEVSGILSGPDFVGALT